jgi:ArsR family transcriptional regulator, arsenate/arsenite/antimonite-responsive transcriptional repressor
MNFDAATFHPESMVVNIDRHQFKEYYCGMTRVAESDLLPVLDDGAVCCPPILSATISEQEAIVAAGIFKALGDPARVRLLSAIAAGSEEGVCVCELTEPLELAQPTVSHHLKVLFEAGLVARERRGTWVYYTLRSDTLALVAQALRA